MRKTIIIGACLVALASLGQAAAKKKAAAESKAEEAESSLSPALARPVDAAQQDLKDAVDAVKKGNSKRPTATVRKLEGLKDDLRDQLSKVREAKVDDEEAGAKDAAIVAVAAALRATDLAAQGLQEGDDDQLKTAEHLAEMADADLGNLQANGAQASAGSGGGDYKIGPSFGGDVSLSGQGNSSNMSSDLSISFPIGQALDLGVGGSLTANSSGSSGSSSSTSTGLGYGLNAFTRYHFLEVFSKAPWIVPYLGLKLGYNYNDSITVGTTTSSETESTSTSLGYQLGTLFFVSAKSAITAQIESSRSSTSSGGTSSPSTSSLTLSMGVRQMF